MKKIFFEFIGHLVFYIHNIAVNDLHKTGSVQYTSFNKFLFNIERTLDAFHYKYYWKAIEEQEIQCWEPIE